MARAVTPGPGTRGRALARLIQNQRAVAQDAVSVGDAATATGDALVSGAKAVGDFFSSVF